MKDGWKTLSQPQEKMLNVLLLSLVLSPSYKIEIDRFYFDEMCMTGFPCSIYITSEYVVDEVKWRETMWLWGMIDFRYKLQYLETQGPFAGRWVVTQHTCYLLPFNPLFWRR